jgi:pilus assembly protein Flp/PilA
VFWSVQHLRTKAGKLQAVRKQAMEDKPIDKPASNNWATNTILSVAHRLGKDEQGAALVEYTVLLGVMLVTVISTVVMVGGWVNAKWSALWAVLQSNQ